MYAVFITTKGHTQVKGKFPQTKMIFILAVFLNFLMFSFQENEGQRRGWQTEGDSTHWCHSVWDQGHGTRKETHCQVSLDIDRQKKLFF